MPWPKRAWPEHRQVAIGGTAVLCGILHCWISGYTNYPGKYDLLHEVGRARPTLLGAANVTYYPA